MIHLQRDRIDIGQVVESVQSSKAGAILLFQGVTRDNFDGRQVVRLEYEAYPEMAVAEMNKIKTEVLRRWPTVTISIVHRLGVVPVGECSVVIAVSSPHRQEAYEANRFAIDTLKSQVPIWKKEIYTDGTIWKENK